MRRRLPPIARIRLARSLPALLAWPVIVLTTGAMALASWFVGSFGSGVGGIAFAIVGGSLVLIGIVAAILLLSIRLEVHEAAVRLFWLGGERVYPLVRGPVTRVRLRGPDASKLRSPIGFFGWAVGSARLRDEEEIQVVRLARTPTAILVPTERGRLAIAAADEEALLDALSRAARARQRLEDLADETSADELDEPVAEPGGREPAPVAEVPGVDLTDVEIEPHVLTGIERAILEQRLADERAAAADAGAAAEAARAAGAKETAPSEQGSRAGDGVEAAPVRHARRARLALPRPRPSVVFVLLPLLGAGVAWGIGLLTEGYPEPGSDLARLTSLALVLAGPATSIGAIMARTWWPRLVGVVVAGGLAASAFIARALLG
jgi:hypothetical protein